MAKKRWIKSTVEHMDKGAFSAKAERAGMSTIAYAHEHDKDNDKLGKEAILAETLIKAGHHRAEKTHKVSASHSTIRKSMYGGQ